MRDSQDKFGYPVGWVVAIPFVVFILVVIGVIW